RMRERVSDAWCLGPREAREAAGVELGRLAGVLSLVVALSPQATLERDVFEILESLRSLSTAPPSGLVASSVVDARRNEATRLREEITDLCRAGPAADSSVDAWCARLRELETRSDRIGQEIRDASPAVLEWLDHVRVPALARSLAPESRIVTFWR